MIRIERGCAPSNLSAASHRNPSAGRDALLVTSTNGVLRFSRKLSRSIAAGAAAIAIAIGAYAVGQSGSSNGASGTASAAPPAQSAQASQVGQVPQNWRPGTGTIITGAAADKAKAVAVAKYPEGTVNRVLKLSDGSYAVHRIGTSGMHHIFVSKDFKVTGVTGAA